MQKQQGSQGGSSGMGEGLRAGRRPWVACPAGEVGTTAGCENLPTPGVDGALALLTRAVGPEQGLH